MFANFTPRLNCASASSPSALAALVSDAGVPKRLKRNRKNGLSMLKTLACPHPNTSIVSRLDERILTLPPAHDRTSLSSFGGEGWGEEAALSESHCRPGLQTRRCPSPQPSPRARLAGRGRNLWWQCQDAPYSIAESACDGLGFRQNGMH